VAKNTFLYLQHYRWWRVIRWLRRKHRRTNWTALRRRHLNNSWQIQHEGTVLFDPRTVPVTRYRYRGTAIPTRWNTLTPNRTA